jgi:hypothetical protein
MTAAVYDPRNRYSSAFTGQKESRLTASQPPSPTAFARSRGATASREATARQTRTDANFFYVQPIAGDEISRRRHLRSQE